MLPFVPAALLTALIVAISLEEMFLVVAFFAVLLTAFFPAFLVDFFGHTGCFLG